MAETSSVQQATALVVSAFFDEIARWGVCEVVVSPGSRSTALAMCAYELGRREPERMTVYVDIDERSASFFALGLAKASGRPVALVCTSGTALANYYPAVLEAETSRVPLIVLSGDRPPHLQGLGAPQTCDQVKALIRGRCALVLAGEGTCESLEEAREMAAWAKAYGLPLLADPLSGLRSLGNEAVIDNYDNVFGHEDFPAPEVVIRFGRYPVSKRCVQKLAAARPIEIVVDAGETRDFNAMTDLFVACSPIDFARSLLACEIDAQASASFLSAWREANAAERARILSVEEDSREGATGNAADGADSESAAVVPRPEGAYVREILKAAPAGSCLFSANSMAVRAIDTFYVKGDKPLAVLCNRGLNGIDGTVSTALGVAQHFEQTTFLTGDFALQHDLGGLALQREIAQVAAERGKPVPSIVVVLLNNNGGGIFEMLPQASDEPYFARLFSAPQDVDFSHAAAAFNVPYRKVCTPSEFSQVYGEMLGTPGISLIEVKLPLSRLKARYRAYQ